MIKEFEEKKKQNKMGIMSSLKQMWKSRSEFECRENWRTKLDVTILHSTLKGATVL